MKTSEFKSNGKEVYIIYARHAECESQNIFGVCNKDKVSHEWATAVADFCEMGPDDLYTLYLFKTSTQNYKNIIGLLEQVEENGGEGEVEFDLIETLEEIGKAVDLVDCGDAMSYDDIFEDEGGDRDDSEAYKKFVYDDVVTGDY